MKFDNFTGAGVQVMLKAREIARKLRHAYVVPAHILLALVESDGIVGIALRTFNTDLRNTHNSLEASVIEEFTGTVGTKHTPLPVEIPFSSKTEEICRHAERMSKSAAVSPLSLMMACTSYDSFVDKILRRYIPGGKSFSADQLEIVVMRRIAEIAERSGGAQERALGKYIEEVAIPLVDKHLNEQIISGTVGKPGVSFVTATTSGRPEIKELFRESIAAKPGLKYVDSAFAQSEEAVRKTSEYFPVFSNKGETLEEIKQEVFEEIDKAIASGELLPAPSEEGGPTQIHFEEFAVYSGEPPSGEMYNRFVVPSAPFADKPPVEVSVKLDLGIGEIDPISPSTGIPERAIIELFGESKCRPASPDAVPVNCTNYVRPPMPELPEPKTAEEEHQQKELLLQYEFLLRFAPLTWEEFLELEKSGYHPDVADSVKEASTEGPNPERDHPHGSRPDAVISGRSPSAEAHWQAGQLMSHKLTGVKEPAKIPDAVIVTGIKEVYKRDRETGKYVSSEDRLKIALEKLAAQSEVLKRQSESIDALIARLK